MPICKPDSDYPLITPEEHSRFMVGVTLPQSFETPKGFGMYEISSGEYAIFRFKGLYHELNRVYRHIYLDWLPTSDYTLREPFTFETYINTPENSGFGVDNSYLYPCNKKRNMKYLNQEIENELRNQGAELIRFVDISHLSETQNRQFPHAIVFALPLTAGYIKEVCDTPITYRPG